MPYEIHALREEPEFEYFTATPASGAIGAFLSGLDLSEPLSEAAAEEVRQALVHYMVIFFRDQDTRRIRENFRRGANGGRDSAARGATGNQKAGIHTGIQCFGRCEYALRRHICGDTLAMFHIVRIENAAPTSAISRRVSKIPK
jgi:hypothetical protein